MMFSTKGIVMLGLWPTLLATLVKRQTAMALHQLSADVNNGVIMNSEGTVKVSCAEFDAVVEISCFAMFCYVIYKAVN